MRIQANTKDNQDQKTARLQEWTESGKQKQLYKRTLAIVVLSQLFGGAGLAAGVTVGALLAQNMLGTERYAGIPVALITLGSALASFLMGRLTQRFGRRSGLAAGFLTGGAGAIGIITAAVASSIPLLYFSLFIYGAGTATNLQARYAGTDLAKPKQRATAISIAMVATTFGAVAGPNLVEVMGDIAESLGIPRLAGPFLLAAAAFTVAGLIILLLMRPDPFLVASITANQSTAKNQQSSMSASNRKKGIRMGAAIMIMTQIVMVSIMTMTPIHMMHHGHGLSDVGVVIGIHVGAMYLPSLFTGLLIDKFGRIKMACASGVVLLSAGLLAAFGSADSMLSLVTALALLGLGWNMGLISGTALIVDSTSQATRAKTQGTVDVLIALAGASGGALSGMIVAASNYATLALAGGLLSLLLIPIMFWSAKGSR
ncbi:MFS transporter [Paenibacillus paeoniae]|uniref:MFS transporter n=1 Tax=Paenibacillus paeoniae TaxID=2292705 RepID=A0A371PLA5_9BACL|nr:MFS transporter [Paenibacillus paeoniae]REK76986.1 MFS transporter [Paenibacillus paeoniae]